MTSRVAAALVCSVGLLLAWASPSQGDPPARPTDGVALFAKARQWIRELPSLEAPFVQVNRWVGWSDDEPDTARGTLHLQRPCCFRLAYTDPPDHEVTCNGETLWTYVPDLEQVIRTPVPEEGVGAGDLFLWLVRSATPDSLAHPVDPPIFRLGVDPPEDIGWVWLEILVDTEDGSIRGYSYEDLQENRTSFSFLGFKPVARVAASFFRFDPPPGVEVVDAP